MDSESENPETLADFVSEDQFNLAIGRFMANRHNNAKPMWTSKRIEEAIKIIEQFKFASSLKLQRTPKHYYYGKKYEIVEIDAEKCLILKRNRDSEPVIQIVATQNYYHILREIHQTTGHGGRDKMLYALKRKYFIPTSAVLEFLKLCTVCHSKRKFPGKGIVCPIVASEFNQCGQVNLIDLQSIPDRHYKWLLHYQDHATKFSFLRPLTSKRATEIAMELVKIFLEIGCPRILQSDNGRELTAAIIEELTSLWPSCKIVIGKLRHPASQGSVDQDVECMLRAWLIDNDTNNWAIGCYFVQFQKNSCFHCNIQRSPYKALFGTEPTSGLQSSLIPKDSLEKLVNEENFRHLLNQEEHIPIKLECVPAVFIQKDNDDSISGLSEYIDNNILINKTSTISTAREGTSPDSSYNRQNPVYAKCGIPAQEEGNRSNVQSAYVKRKGLLNMKGKQLHNT